MEVTNSTYRNESEPRGIPMVDSQMNISFEINEDGKVENISIDSTLNEENIKEALLTIEKFRSWMPLENIGNRCKINLCLPVSSIRNERRAG